LSLSSTLDWPSGNMTHFAIIKWKSSKVASKMSHGFGSQLTMSTGSLAVVLSQTPYRFRGLLTIGKIVFIVDIVFFCALCTCFAIRLMVSPENFKSSLSHPTESVYFGTFWVSVALLITNMASYAAPSCGQWLAKTLQVLFWCYYAFVLLVSVIHYEG